MRCIMTPNRPKESKEHGSLREDHEPAWIYLSIGGCPSGCRDRKLSDVRPQATFGASDMEAISDFRLYLQMVFAHILTGLAPKGSQWPKGGVLT